MDAAELKRKIRQLKAIEMRLRYNDQSLSSYGNSYKDKVHGKAPLLWEEFFDLKGNGQRTTAKYSIDQLLRMDKEQYRSIVNEFFFRIYYRIYQEKGIADINIYDPELLQQMGLPYDADSNTVKKRFRELAKQYHPDAGGDSEEFIKLMEIYHGMKEMD